MEITAFLQSIFLTWNLLLHLNTIPVSSQEMSDNFTGYTDLCTWEAPASIKKALPYSLVGFDYDKRRVYFFPYGKWDVRKIVETGGKDYADLYKYYTQMRYRMRFDGKKYTRPNEKMSDEIVLIYDLDHWSVYQMLSIPMVKFFADTMGQFRLMDDIVEYGFYVNANSIAQTAINIARPNLGSFMERMEVYGTQKHKWIPKLLHRIPRDQLPPELGGFKNHTGPVEIT